MCNFQQHITTVTDTQSSLTCVLTYNGCSLGQECSESRTAAAVAQTEISGVKYFTSISTVHNKARQTRFIVSHQPLTQFACGQVSLFIIHY